MQGIPLFDYKIMQEQLSSLLESPAPGASAEDIAAIAARKKKLTEIYKKYGSSFDEISSLTRQFRKMKIEVRQLMSLRQKKIKVQIKKTVLSVKANGHAPFIALLTITQF
ncbi:hypothetical protein [Ferruginibacter sp. HRS2-29]|uniref:hypothetical protein n=1 Tax=Ferruginibacter sp. HRS2-29 TaxID=2487334 RepID=UPI0020CDB045|nr:hypothetical protein [Ferruginibacter sp. HRS2-29]MCP9751976.1 hypothetical protein [Ferruginibacter sp. HRS2-29]